MKSVLSIPIKKSVLSIPLKKKAISLLVAAFLISQFPHVLSFRITGLKPLGGSSYRVKGRVELERTGDYLEWIGPNQFPSFNAWWQSQAAVDYVSDYTGGLLLLDSINWKLIKSKTDSDVLKFTAVFTVAEGIDEGELSLLLKSKPYGQDAAELLEQAQKAF